MNIFQLLTCAMQIAYTIRRASESTREVRYNIQNFISFSTYCDIHLYFYLFTLNLKSMYSILISQLFICLWLCTYLFAGLAVSTSLHSIMYGELSMQYAWHAPWTLRIKTTYDDIFRILSSIWWGYDEKYQLTLNKYSFNIFSYYLNIQLRKIVAIFKSSLIYEMSTNYRKQFLYMVFNLFHLYT